MIIGYIEFTLRANSLPLLLKILGYYGGGGVVDDKWDEKKKYIRRIFFFGLS